VYAAANRAYGVTACNLPMASSRMPGEAINADEGFEKTKETDG
jgi:hypothetical protein